MWDIQQETRRERQQALLPLLLRALPSAERATHLQVLLEALGQDPAKIVVFVARSQSQPQGVILAQLQAGKAALLWPPRVNGDQPAQLAAQLLEQMLAKLQILGVEVLQALLPIGAEEDRLLLEQAGFHSAAELVYLICEVDANDPSAPAFTLRWESVTPDDVRLAPLVEATYQNSLDCPMIDGWRKVSDVLEGYRQTGTYRPALWNIAWQGSELVGCSIAADFPANKQWEFIYWGVHPHHRGKGYGRQLVNWVVQQARQQGVERILLAVDAANHPALNIYRECGFFEFDRRWALAKQIATKRLG